MTGIFLFSQEAQGQSGEVFLESPNGLSPKQSEYIIERIVETYGELDPELIDAIIMAINESSYDYSDIDLGPQSQIDQAVGIATMGMIPEYEYAKLSDLGKKLIELTYYKKDASYELGTYGGMIGRTLKKKFTDGNTGDELFELDDCKSPGYIHTRAVKVLNEEWTEYLEVIESIRGELE